MNKDDRELIARFRRDAVKPFSEEALLDDIGGQSLPSRAGQGTALNLAELGDYENLEPLVMLLEEALAKFEFGKHSLEEWKTKYVFPRPSSLKRYARQQFGSEGKLKAKDRDRIVNQSPEHVERWVKRVIREIIKERRSGAPPVFVLAGGTGAGKSTLNKYITNVHFTDFRSAKIIASRVEYRKLSSYLKRRGVFVGTDRNAMALSIRARSQKYVLVCCFRDLLYSAFTSPQVQSDGHTRLKPTDEISSLGIDLRVKEVADDFREFIAREYVARCNADVEATIVSVLRASSSFQDADVGRRTSWFSRTLTEPMASAEFLALELYLYFAVSRGFRLYIIFDGFDYIQTSDFLHNTSHALALKTLADWIVEDEGRLPLPRVREQVKPTIQVTMRNSTVQSFWKDQSLAWGQFRNPIYFVSPPELRDLYNAVTARIETEHPEFAGWRLGAGLDLFNRVQRGLAEVTTLSLPEVSALFLENTRHRINYVRHVLEAALSDAIEDVADLQALQPGELIRLLWDAMTRITTRKNYRLIEVLLQSKNDRFANFVRITDVSRWLDRENLVRHGLFVSEDILQDNNIQSGYVGNIFNYHIPYRSYSDIGYFLEKVRILRLLEDGNRLSAKQISAAFVKKKWKASRYLDISIAVLIREALIEAAFANPSGVYQITPLGSVLVKKMIKKISYLENVYFGCEIPGAITIDSVNILRSASKRIEWVAASIYHTWVLLRLIRTAELNGEAFVFDRVHEQIEQEVTRIVESEAAQWPLGSRLSALVLRYMRRLDSRLEAVS